MIYILHRLPTYVTDSYPNITSPKFQTITYQYSIIKRKVKNFPHTPPKKNPMKQNAALLLPQTLPKFQAGNINISAILK